MAIDTLIQKAYGSCCGSDQIQCSVLDCELIKNSIYKACINPNWSIHTLLPNLIRFFSFFLLWFASVTTNFLITSYIQLNPLLSHWCPSPHFFLNCLQPKALQRTGEWKISRTGINTPQNYFTIFCPHFRARSSLKLLESLLHTQEKLSDEERSTSRRSPPKTRYWFSFSVKPWSWLIAGMAPI